MGTGIHKYLLQRASFAAAYPMEAKSMAGDALERVHNRVRGPRQDHDGWGSRTNGKKDDIHAASEETPH